VFSSSEFWLSVAGLVFLAAGLVSYRKDLAAAPGLGKLIVLGPVFVAAPLATFGAEHLKFGRLMMNLVPAWMPERVFWVYFVGASLFAAALSLTFRRYVRWCAPLLALMFFIFVFTIHLPNVIQEPKNRILWAVMLRDTSFAAGALALTSITLSQKFSHASHVLVFIARILIAVALLFFGVEHFLHPEFAPGVPLEKITPASFPLRIFWAELVGAILLVAGAALIIDKRGRLAATLAGLVMVLVTLFLYSPILATDRGTAQVIEGINYVADTLLYGGVVLFLAAAMRSNNAE
jgi:uncharacterized membrane protein YphA (DoxX/SURF4 family)